MAASGKNPSLDVKDAKSASGAGPVFSKKSSLRGKILTAYDEIIALLKNLQQRYETEIKKKFQDTIDENHYNSYVKNVTGGLLLNYLRAYARSTPGMEPLHDKCNQVLILSAQVEKAKNEKPIKKESLAALKKAIEDAKPLLSQSRGILESRGAAGLSGAETIKRILSKLDPLIVEMDKRKERKVLTDEKSKKIIIEIQEIFIEVEKSYKSYLQKLYGPAVNNDIKQLQKAVKEAVDKQVFTSEQLELLQEVKLDPKHWSQTNEGKLYFRALEKIKDRSSALPNAFEEKEMEDAKKDLEALKQKQLSVFSGNALEMLERLRVFKDAPQSLNRAAIQVITTQSVAILLIVKDVDAFIKNGCSFSQIISRLCELLSTPLHVLMASQQISDDSMLNLWVGDHKSKTIQEIFVLSAIPENLKSMKDRFFTPKSLVDILKLLAPYKPKPAAAATAAAAAQADQGRDHKSDYHP